MAAAVAMATASLGRDAEGGEAVMLFLLLLLLSVVKNSVSISLMSLLL